MKNENLVMARQEKGLTQEELAKMLGYKGKQTIANWESGYAYPTLNKAIEASEILEKSVSFLFSYKVQKISNESKFCMKGGQNCSETNPNFVKSSGKK
ncbi:helix-turn-helix transcriptional regulator [Halalkalibacterium ligniniphilum]|uniref:helix-turn-helix transcriptional regulator n=1 Tax=Halalkalibacterium ligniniphilum TaxID=1134413 RepID=UPI00034D35FC|nr:helix-turn-helix transcriptional regulator [Halalkalibacterium ligniniphilum]